MLDFRWDRFFWTAQTRLPSWAGFHSVAGYDGPPPDRPPDGTASLILRTEDEEELPVTARQRQMAEWVVENEQAIFAGLIEGLLKQYPSLQSAYGYDEQTRLEIMPDVASAAGFRDLIELAEVYVHSIEKGSVPYVGLGFDCSWDPEHGLGVMMHGAHFVDAGDRDVAWSPLAAEEDAAIDRA